ncbi:hypothetical protein DSAG12_01810 [Promethearchaeum syntrophicum]|uniref:Uncharacterized protein n=1 Tax=Promethearchaeum syntrophicum TaxID=2594042 RepID=A0A5B9DA79_9ARCH
MQVKKNHIQIVLSVIIGLIFACFGVFLFSNFQYRGLTIKDNVYPSISAGNFNSFMYGIWVLLGSGFMADWFLEFSAANIANSSIGAILFGDTILPAILTWFTVGFSISIIVKGFKRGLIVSLIIFLSVFFLWLITGIFAGADITAIFITNILNTLSEIFTILISLIPGSVIGGLIRTRLVSLKK